MTARTARVESTRAAWRDGRAAPHGQVQGEFQRATPWSTATNAAVRVGAATSWRDMWIYSTGGEAEHGPRGRAAEQWSEGAAALRRRSAFAWHAS
jgi:hypothetical protein